MLKRAEETSAAMVREEVTREFSPTELKSPATGDHYRQLTEKVSHLVLGGHIFRVVIWNRNSRIVWSSDPELVGKSFPDNVRLNRALRGTVSSALTGRDHLEGADTGPPSPERVLELYIPIRFTAGGGIDNVFEIYKNAAPLYRDIRRHTTTIWVGTLSGLAILFLILYGLISSASRRLQSQATAILDVEERYRNLVESAQDGIISIDRSLRLRFANRAAADMFGQQADELVGLPLGDLIAEPYREPLLQDLQTIFADARITNKWRDRELTARKRNSGTFPVELSLSLHGRNDETLATLILRDITSRKQMQAMLVRAKEEWEETFDTINDAITIHDRYFNIIRSNRAAEQLLGIDMDEILERKCFQSYHGRHCPPDVCPSCETMQTGRPTLAEIFEPHLGKHIEIKALPRLDDDGGIIGVVHVVRDIDARKRAEERQKHLERQLMQSQKMESVGRLAGGIAHDFNNILSAILGYSELALEELPADHPLSDNLSIIKESGEKAAALTRQLLAFSRKQVLEIQLVRLNDLVGNMAKLLGRLIGEDVELELMLDGPVATVLADPGQLEQIIMNLTVNARDAMPQGGRCRIETTVEELGPDRTELTEDFVPGRYARLTIADSGTGMPAEICDKIFEPFFTTKEEGKGTGLGLATVYGIVKQHRGHILVDSEQERGTAFTIYLPFHEGPEVAAGRRESMTMPTGEETILVVEDDTAIRRLVANILQPLGYNLLLASNGEEALRIAGEYRGRIHLLLTDVIMPKMSGRELADRLTENLPGIRIIYMSGYTDETLVRHGLQEKNKPLLHKPLTPSRLAGKIREILDA